MYICMYIITQDTNKNDTHKLVNQMQRHFIQSKKITIITQKINGFFMIEKTLSIIIVSQNKIKVHITKAIQV